MAKKSKDYLILTINPGSTSTKIGVSKNNELVYENTVRHSTKMLEMFDKIWDQYTFRKDEIVEVLEDHGYELTDFDAVVGRGGLIKPIPSGVYIIDEDMIQHARIGYQGNHASNLGCVIAYSIGWEFSIPAFIVDPPAVDELEPVARISGYAGIERTSLLHALNAFETSRIFARDQQKQFADMNLIVAHMGGGITVTAMRKGRAINVNNGIDEGPFSPERSGRLPMLQFMKLCLSGKYTEDELKKMIVGKGGLNSYCNTNKATEIESMIKAGSDRFRTVYEAMAYQIAEEIGSRATNLKGEVDAVILTGGLAHSEMLTGWIKERVAFIAPVHIYPGELELEALAAGALRVLKGEEKAKHYTVVKRKIGIFYWTELELYTRAIRILEGHFGKNNYKFRTADSNLELIYTNCQQSEDKVHETLNYYQDIDVDLIMAIGSPASVRAAQYLTQSNIPVICVGVYNQNTLTSINWNTHTHFHASCYATSLEEHINSTIKMIQPEVKKLGLMYKIGELQSEIQYDELKSYCESNSIELIATVVQDERDWPEAYQFFVKEQIDWLVLGGDTNIANANAEKLAWFTQQIPTLCILENSVLNSGGLISYQPSWQDVCDAAAGLSIKIFEGESIQKKVILPSNRRLLVNKHTAKKLGLLEKMEALPDVKFINV